MAFLTQGSSGSFETIGAIEASVERVSASARMSDRAGAADDTPWRPLTFPPARKMQIEDGTAVLMIRGSGKVVEKTLVDVPIVMGLMPNAIRQAVMSSRMPPSA